MSNCPIGRISRGSVRPEELIGRRSTGYKRVRVLLTLLDLASGVKTASVQDAVQVLCGDAVLNFASSQHLTASSAAARQHRALVHLQLGVGVAALQHVAHEVASRQRCRVAIQHQCQVRLRY
jgi:hypothetical protein